MKLCQVPALLASLASPLLSTRTAQAYDQQDESAFLANFPTLVSTSHSELVNAPAGLLSSCINQGKLSSFRDVIISNNATTVSSFQVQQDCGIDANCIIPQNVKLIMESDLNVGSLTILGELEWKDSSSSNYYLCAGYILTDGSSSLFHVDLTSDSGWIYVKNNGAKPTNVNMLGERVLGTDNGGNMIVRGRKIARTWSLLQRSFGFDEDVMALIHNVVEMGWKVGDRIAIAPTQHGSSGTGQAFTIAAIINDYTIQLSHKNTDPQAYESTFINGHSSSPPVLKSAEVMNLSRNIVITGDDFEHVPCDPAITSNEETSSMGCKCSATRTQCTIGLHAIHHGRHDQQGMSPPGTMVISSTRIEKCGQRGIEGKYCLHFHKVRDCPDCIFEDNAVEFGMHRGITVHGTHRSIVKGNVLYNIRGANVYIEDGNEMYNEISYNVAVCPNPLSDPILQGCSIPGTSTPGADSPNAAFYSKAATNDWTGNRAANTYNGMLLDAGTRGDANGKVCASDSALGRWVGNTMHGCSRFGLYTLGHGGNFPKHTDRSIATNGFNQDFDMCSGFDDTENIHPSTTDRGYPAAFYENVDYHNVFVGHYMAGDLQHRGHSSINNNNLIYWKETKNMADGCSSHFYDAYYAFGNMALPDQGSVIITKTKFGQNVHLECNHHCDVGSTGLLCMPQIIFDEVEWENTSQNKWVSFQAGYNNDGGIISLAPGRETSSTGFFPDGFTSLAGGTYSYLLSSPGPRKCIDTSASFGNRYDNGILCNAPLRSFKIYSRGLTEATAPMLKVEVWFNSLGLRGQNGPANAEQMVGFHIIGGPDSTNEKQGYAFPIMSGLEQSYKISLYDNVTSTLSEIPSDWVIEFSDPVIGNRFGSDDEVFVNLLGRFCGVNNDGLISSQHDRRFLWSGDHFIDSRAWGVHGACTASPDMFTVDCSAIVGGNGNAEGSIEASECPELCAASPCNPANSFCQCGSPSTCKCKPGFYGADCSLDVCASANCGAHGLCTSRYLGGEGNVQVEATTRCICEAGWFGSKCDVNPCEVGATAKTCSGNGKCFSSNGIDTQCQCNLGFLGSECNIHNLAHGKPSTTSSELQPSSRAFDGNTGSRWESVHGVDNVWLQVDLGDVYNLNEVEILWEATAAKAYEIQVSNDGFSFTAVWNKTDGYSGIGTVVSNISGASARFVRMQAFQRTLQYGYSIWEMRIYGNLGETSPPTPHPTYKFFTLSPTVSSAPSDAPVTLSPTIPRVELAQGKTSSASSGNNAAFRAFDGNIGSRWESVHGVNDVWIQVDLGAIYELTKVITHWETASAKSYDVQVSDDGVSFTTVWTKANGFAGIGTVQSNIESVSARFVRLQCYERATIYGYSVWEVEVWGIDNEPSGPTTSAPSRSPSNLPCDGVCIGSYPYGCATNLSGIVKYGCLPNGGCHYLPAGEDYPYAGFCTYKEISPPSSGPTTSPSRSPNTKNPTNFPSSSPSMPPTKNPTKSPTSNPTHNPTSHPTAAPSSQPTHLTGYCTDGNGRCLPTNMSQCACAVTSDPAQIESIFGRRKLQSCEGRRSKDCTAPDCEWAGKNGCIAALSPEPTNAQSHSPTNAPIISAPTSPPTHRPSNPPVTDAPSKAPTNAPTSKPSMGVLCGCSITAMPNTPPTSAPTNKPTSNPTDSPTQKPITDQPTDSPTTQTPTTSTPPPTGSVHTINKYLCSKNEQLPELICADGSPSGAECQVENSNSGCGTGGKVCWWASCNMNGNPPTTSSPTGSNPYPTTSPSTGCGVTGVACLYNAECCSGSCDNKGRNPSFTCK